MLTVVQEEGGVAMRSQLGWDSGEGEGGRPRSPWEQEEAEERPVQLVVRWRTWCEDGAWTLQGCWRPAASLRACRASPPWCPSCTRRTP